MKEEKAGRFFCSLFYCFKQREKPLISVVAFVLTFAPSTFFIGVILIFFVFARIK